MVEKQRLTEKSRQPTEDVVRRKRLGQVLERDAFDQQRTEQGIVRYQVWEKL
ncbi:MAG: hypothetical protein LBM61_08815 [Prevotellaceae bacterium]|jgi:hypothetical protein|nr:hypothetical protein [Prevotellaceae bacterium]